jgi:hypothetical protein
LNRSTLTRRSEDEIRAAQAIKNNQDFIYATNVALNLLKDEIKSLRSLIEKERAERGREIKEIQIHVEKALEDFVVDMASFDAHLDEITLIQKKNKLEIECLITLYQCVLGSCNDREKEYDSLKNSSFQLMTKYDKCIELMKSHAYHFDRGLSEWGRKLREELTVIKPQIDPLEVKLNEQIAIMKVDHQGLYKEINLLKKSTEYAQKKIEAIFDKIGMKKAGDL